MKNNEELKELQIVATRLLQKYSKERKENFLDRFERITKQDLGKFIRYNPIQVEDLARKVLTKTTTYFA